MDIMISSSLLLILNPLKSSESSVFCMEPGRVVDLSEALRIFPKGMSHLEREMLGLLARI